MLTNHPNHFEMLRHICGRKCEYEAFINSSLTRGTKDTSLMGPPQKVFVP